ncbi:MAG: hypothetical protein RJA59_1653 [Pseudomonadota bacterium]
MTYLAALVALARAGWSPDEAIRALHEARDLDTLTASTKPAAPVSTPASDDGVRAAWMRAFVRGQGVELGPLLRRWATDGVPAHEEDLRAALLAHTGTLGLTPARAGTVLSRCTEWADVPGHGQVRLRSSRTSSSRRWTAEVRGFPST